MTESGRGCHRDTQNGSAGDRRKIEPGGEAAVSRGSWAEPQAPGVKADPETRGIIGTVAKPPAPGPPGQPALEDKTKTVLL